jgi:hypothetical protein
VPIATPIRVHLYANDVDSLPVNFTRAEIGLAFAGRNISMQWSRGSNHYVADVQSSEPGSYDLVVTASNAWKENGSGSSCELLRRTITVKEGLSTSWIMVGAACAALVIIGGLMILVRKRHAHLQAIMVMLFTEATHRSTPPGMSRPRSCSLWSHRRPGCCQATGQVEVESMACN